MKSDFGHFFELVLSATIREDVMADLLSNPKRENAKILGSIFAFVRVQLAQNLDSRAHSHRDDW